mmetsp:Transcript_4828/g.8610  ORF Transcript_4828/g.8610 Transcript_4828/m.8610 type:complete len:256 (-) Transcript_4828:1411-2178(-)
MLRLHFRGLGKRYISPTADGGDEQGQGVVLRRLHAGLRHGQWHLSSVKEIASLSADEVLLQCCMEPLSIIVRPHVRSRRWNGVLLILQHLVVHVHIDVNREELLKVVQRHNLDRLASLGREARQSCGDLRWEHKVLCNVHRWHLPEFLCSLTSGLGALISLFAVLLSRPRGCTTRRSLCFSINPSLATCSICDVVLPQCLYEEVGTALRADPHEHLRTDFHKSLNHLQSNGEAIVFALIPMWLHDGLEGVGHRDL